MNLQFIWLISEYALLMLLFTVIQDRKELLLIIPILQKFFEVHTTLPHIPDALKQFNLVNHGQLDREEYLELANKAKVNCNRLRNTRSIIINIYHYLQCD